LAPRFGSLIEKCALLLSFFYFKAGADELVNLIWDEQVTFAELSIDVIIWSKYPPAKPGALVLEPLKAAYPCRTTQASLPLCGMLYAS
jgi:hypothetical protein